MDLLKVFGSTICHVSGNSFNVIILSKDFLRGCDKNSYQTEYKYYEEFVSCEVRHKKKTMLGFIQVCFSLDNYKNLGILSFVFI